MKNLTFYYLITFCCFNTIYSCSFASQSNSDNQEAIQAILKLYDTKPVVLLGESHGRQEYHNFLIDLLSNPKTSRKIDDVIVEFGNALYQDIADKYVFGESVSEDSLKLIWQNTTQLFVWDSPVYEQFFKAVRAINSGKKKKNKIRVLLGDPPINWTAVTTPVEYEQYLAQRDIYPFELIEREVLQKNRKGLVVIGGMHVLFVDLKTAKAVKDRDRASLGQLLKEKYKDQIFAIWSMEPEVELAEQFLPGSKVIFKEVKDALFAQESFQQLYAGTIQVQVEVNGRKEWIPLSSEKWPKIETAIDGVLYLGAESTEVEASDQTYTSEYLKKLEARAKVIDEYFGWNGYETEINRIRNSQ